MNKFVLTRTETVFENLACILGIACDKLERSIERVKRRNAFIRLAAVAQLEDPRLDEYSDAVRRCRLNGESGCLIPLISRGFRFCPVSAAPIFRNEACCNNRETGTSMLDEGERLLRRLKKRWRIRLDGSKRFSKRIHRRCSTIERV